MNEERKQELIRVYETLPTDRLKEILKGGTAWLGGSRLIKAELLRRNIPENELPSDSKLKRMFLTNLKNAFMLGFLLLLVGIMIFVFFYDFTPEQKSNSLSLSKSSRSDLNVNMGQICFPEYDSSEGKLLFSEIQQKYKDCDLSLMLISDYKVKYCLIIPIPIDEYQILSIEERKKIMNYVSSLIPDAKKNYGRYLILPPSAPVFQTNVFEKYTEIMNYRCCAIAIGPIEKDYYYKTGSGVQVYGNYVAEERLIYPDDLHKGIQSL